MSGPLPRLANNPAEESNEMNHLTGVRQGATANQLPLSGRTGKVEFSDNPPFDLEVRGNPPVTPPARRLYYTYW
jgi:hypothetical protein